MTVLSRTPENPNLLHGNKFQFLFSRIPTVQYFCQKANIPGISSDSIYRNTPFVDLPSPGDKLKYNDLSIEFMVDEDLKNWIEIHDWMRAMTFPTKYQEYLNLKNVPKGVIQDDDRFHQFSDAALTTLSTSNTATLRFKFINTFPVMLSDIDFDAKKSPEDIVIASATFRYSYYDIDRIGVIDC